MGTRNVCQGVGVEIREQFVRDGSLCMDSTQIVRLEGKGLELLTHSDGFLLYGAAV